MGEPVDVEDQEATAADGDEAQKKNPHKHEGRSAADLEKVTDYVEETELSSQASASVKFFETFAFSFFPNGLFRQ